MKAGIAFGLLLLVSGLASPTAGAVEVRYALNRLHDDVYRYDYVIRNDGSLGAGVALQSLDLLFDTGSYEEASLTIASMPTSGTAWSPSFLNAAPGVPAAFDLYTTGPGLAPGEMLAGFAVQFRWLGNGSPTGQAYEVYDALTFALLQTGSTVALPVPEPAGLWLWLAGGATICGVVRRRHGLWLARKPSHVRALPIQRNSVEKPDREGSNEIESP